MKTAEDLEKLIEPVISALGYELWYAELVRHGHEAFLRIYIDHPDGINVDDCERVSREVAAVLDVEDPIRGAYRLEVSSPGLDRRLVKRTHFQRFSGSEVRVEMLAPVDGQRRFRGTLLDVDGRCVGLRTAQGDVQLPWADIDKARLVPDVDIARTR
ncbi:MAG TPA: ribosome maturation factor RimP [Nevskiaceae bacterium]